SPELPLFMRFTRLDDGSAVDAAVDLSLQHPDPELNGLLRRLESGEADGPALARLGALWQQRGRQLLIDQAGGRGIFIVRKGERWRAVPPPKPNMSRRRA